MTTFAPPDQRQQAADGTRASQDGAHPYVDTAAHPTNPVPPAAFPAGTMPAASTAQSMPAASTAQSTPGAASPATPLRPVPPDPTAAVPRNRSRFAWLGILVGGALLYWLVLTTMITTRNVIYFPTMLLLGSAVVPATVLTYAIRGGRRPVGSIGLVRPRSTDRSGSTGMAAA